jgi:hypothetical protein
MRFMAKRKSPPSSIRQFVSHEPAARASRTGSKSLTNRQQETHEPAAGGSDVAYSVKTQNYGSAANNCSFFSWLFQYFCVSLQLF